MIQKTYSFSKNRASYGWVHDLSRIQSHQELMSYFFKTMKNLFPHFQFIFLRYLAFRDLILVTHTQGIKGIKGQGLYLSKLKKTQSLTGFKDYAKDKELRLFFKTLLKKDDFIAFPLESLGSVKGFIVIGTSFQNQDSLDQKNKDKKRDKIRNEDEVRGKEREDYFSTSVKILSLLWEKLNLQMKLHTSKYEEEFPLILKRTYFLEQLDKEFSRARQIKLPLSLVLISIDDFSKFRLLFKKDVSHLLERKMVKLLALALQRNTRRNDIIGRLSLGEFGLILPHTNKIGGSQMAERIRAIVEASHFSSSINKKEEKISITISLGLSEYPSQCKIPEEALRLADEALYQVKKNGQNRVCLAAPFFDSFIPDFKVMDERGSYE